MNKVEKFILSLPNLSFAYLFGSRAKNTYREDSDFDICIVINNNDKNETRKLLVNFLLENKEFIQPLILTEEEFNKKIDIDIYRNEIIKNGIKIEKNNIS